MEKELHILKHDKKYDVVVCGCGSAGFCAAIAAARNGMRTAVVDKYGMPGGILTVLGNNSIDQFNNPFRKDKKMIIAGIGWEYVRRLYRDGFAKIPDMNMPYIRHDQYGVRVNPVAAAKVMDDMLLEAGVELFYGQPVVDTLINGQQIKGVVISTKDGLKVLEASVFIDCTGDGDVAHFAGATTYSGECGKIFQPGTLRYYPAVNADEHDKILNFGDNCNHVKINTTDSDSLTQTEISARKMMYEQMLCGKQIMGTAPAVAPREGRRIKGLTEMKVKDYFSGKHYEDSVCYTFWFVDIHRDGQEAEIHYINSEKTPSVRLSSMISADFYNLMMAGRCISSDRATNSAIRVKASCMAMGETVGTAAALAINAQTKVAELPIECLKAALYARGAIVPGLSDGEEFFL